MINIIQRNIRGLRANKEELCILLNDFIPEVVCLQETLLKADSDIHFKHYSVYHRPGPERNDIFHVGVAILIKDTLAHRHIKLQTSLQAVACLLYTSPSPRD